MILGIDNRLIAISLAMSLKLWKGESRTIAFTKGLSDTFEWVLTTEFLKELLELVKLRCLVSSKGLALF
jgi:hypothetical protein